MMEEDKAKLLLLKQEKDKMQDQNRDMECELLMLDEVSKNAQERQLQKCEDVEHKIETLKLKQEKIEDQSKFNNQVPKPFNEYL